MIHSSKELQTLDPLSSKAQGTWDLAELDRILTLESQALLQCTQRYKTNLHLAQDWSRALDLAQSRLDQGAQLVWIGIGKTALVFQKIVATLGSLGFNSRFIHATEAQHGDLGFVGPMDLVFLGSHSGQSAEVLALLPLLSLRKITWIGWGGSLDSPLAKEAKIWIDVSIQEEACPNDLVPSSSTTLSLALGDAFALTLMQRMKVGPQDFAVHHPGGALGKRLSCLVQELMQPIDAIASLGPSSSLAQVLKVAEETRLGAVLIVNSKQELLGLITDGDLRNQLKLHSTQGLCARDFMNSKPTFVLSQMRAYEALRLMEDRDHQISVLPVLDSQTHLLVGLLRLHDLVNCFSSHLQVSP